MPKRIMLNAGDKLPANTVLVGGNSRWSNPAKVSEDGVLGWIVTFKDEITQCGNREEAHEYAVFIYNQIYSPYKHGGRLEDFYYSKAVIEQAKLDLAGKDLADYTPLEYQSHADTLLKLAN